MSQSIPTWCWYCKQEIPTVADVCPYCGKRLNDATKVVRCQKCGKFLLKNVPRCTECGAPTPQPERPAAPAESPGPPAGAPATPPAEPSVPSAEADAPPIEPSVQGEEVGTPPTEPSAQNTGTDAETVRMFEELELLSARKVQSSSAGNASKGSAPIILIALLFVVAVLGITFGVSHVRGKNPNRVVYCADDKHQWIEADCATPKTCAICGKTEGKAEGHQYVENVCAVCGKYERLFYFTDSESERNGGVVFFHGNIKNFTEAEVQSLQIELQLYDRNKTLVETLPGTTIEGAGLAPFESTAWQIRYEDSTVQWKYWRVYVSDYSPRA